MCSVLGCERAVYARTWCHMHWMRWWRRGDLQHGRLQTRAGFVLTNSGRRAAGLPVRYIEAEP